MQRHLYDSPPSLSAVRPDLSPALDRVLARAMAKRPQDRFGTCAEFAAAARRALSDPSRPQTAATVPLNGAATPTVHMTAAVPPAGAPTIVAATPKRSRTRLFAGIGAAALVVVVAVAGALYLTRPEPTQTSAGTHESIWEAFPRMVPVDTDRKEGFRSASCKNYDPADRPSDTADDGLDFGRWTAQWECESGGDYKDPTFRFYAYKSAADVAAVVALLDSSKKFTATNNGRTYTNYRVKSYWGEAIVTTFLDTDDRAPYLMYSRPKSSSTPQDIMEWWRNVRLE